MKRFNQTRSEQIVTDECNKHIEQFGNVVYSVSGFMPTDNSKRMGNKSYQQLKDNIYSKLRDEFTPSTTFYRFVNSISRFIDKTNIKVGLVHFDSNNKPTFTEPDEIKPSFTIKKYKD
jgi:hypothetical protein